MFAHPLLNTWAVVGLIQFNGMFLFAYFFVLHVLHNCPAKDYLKVTCLPLYHKLLEVAPQLHLSFMKVT